MGCQFSAQRRSLQISPPYSFASPPYGPIPRRSGVSISIDRRSEHLSVTSERSLRRVIRIVGIDVLPDDVLLDIFNFYVDMNPFHDSKWDTESWRFLAHVCRRWRSLVLGSPRRLHLRLYCTHETPVRDMLNVWPTLPLVVDGNMVSLSGMDNIIAALRQNNRVCHVKLLYLVGRQLEEILASMQVPFPELTYLMLTSDDEIDETLPVIPDSFLGGSAPQLRHFSLDGIPVPRLPNLPVLLSATHLVRLWLSNIPHSGYISPKAMVALLPVLSSLESLSLGFRSPQSLPDQETRRLPPSKCSVIPALTVFEFKGVTEYLEDLVALIDTPQLQRMYITFFNQIDFDIPRLAQFIIRTPKFMEHEIHVHFDEYPARVLLRSGSRNLEIIISCKEPDWQLSSMEQVCSSSLYPLSKVEDLYIEHEYQKLVWKGDAIENTLWLQLLLPFTAVKNLYLSEQFAPGIAVALQELVGITQVLPNLQNIFVKALKSSGPFQENIGRFVAARQLSDHPITVSDWDTD